MYKNKDGVNIIIHVIERGDSLYKIGLKYNIDYRRIAEVNEIPLDQILIVGQTIVIPDDSKKTKSIEVNGYIFTNVGKSEINKIVSSLTYLSIFSYSISRDGILRNIDDDDLIRFATSNQVLPVMVVTNIGQYKRFDSNLLQDVLKDEVFQNTLIDQILNILLSKGYSGVNIDFEYVYPQNEKLYLNFLKRLKNVISNYGYFLMVSVAPKTSNEQKGLLYEAHNYSKIGEIADRVILMTYEWGYSGGEAMPVAPIDLVEGVLTYAVTVIPTDKILLGIPNYGYDWLLPYVEGNLATSIGNLEAVDMVRKKHQSISYDKERETPYYFYYDDIGSKHEVWFEDARSIKAKLELVTKYGLKGISYWTLNRPFPQNYLVLNSLFNINKYQ